MKYKQLIILAVLLAFGGMAWAQALHLDDTDEYANLGQDTYNQILEDASGITIEAWLYPTSFPVNPEDDRRSIAFISLNGAAGAAHVYLYDFSGKVRFNARSASTDSPEVLQTDDAIPLNTWTHLAATVDFSTGERRIYFNGDLKASDTVSFDSDVYIPYAGNTVNDGIGIHPSVPNFVGRIDEVRFWNRARTEQQIDTFMNNEIDTSNQVLLISEGLIGYWQMNEESGTTAKDSSPSGEDATLENGATFGTGVNIDDPITPPVELSSFTATFTATNFVTLHWVTQSETNVYGYYLYRSTDNDLATAQIVSPLIPATNTATMQSYSFQDRELSESGLYYYWLQSVDYDSSFDFHGPITVDVNFAPGGDSPQIPLFTSLKSVYPNPFNASAAIVYGIEKSSAVEILIFNTKGQLVRAYDEGTKAADTYTLQWDGKDSNGNDCPSGVYLVRMQAGDVQSHIKALLQK